MLNFLLSWLTENKLWRFRANQIQKFPFCSIVLFSNGGMEGSGGRYFTKILILSILTIRMLVSILSPDIDNFDIGLLGFDH